MDSAKDYGDGLLAGKPYTPQFRGLRGRFFKGNRLQLRGSELWEFSSSFLGNLRFSS